jgi:hypothetical protein
MTTLTGNRKLERREENFFLVVHPLDDLPEQKLDIANLGPMSMTRSVRLSLLALRAYLVLMMLLVFYHVLGIAGVFGGR